MRTLFIAAGPLEWGSSRMRAWWVAEVMGADCVQHGQPITPDYDAHIWQKSVNLKTIKALPDARHYWDVCDPSWWWQPDECGEIAAHMTAVVASSKALADDFNEWYGRDIAICIPDRLKLSHFHTQRQHADVTPVRLIWFGVAVNRIALLSAMPFLERLVANGNKIELTIMDDRPEHPLQWTKAFPIYHTKWELDREVETLASHDIALLPPYPGAWGRVKSINKTLTAWACGLSVWDGLEYRSGAGLMERTNRELQTRGGQRTVKEMYTVDKSAAEWEALLS